MTLLTGAGLLIRSAWLVQHVDPGFDPRGVLTSRILLPQIHYADPARISRRSRASATRRRAFPACGSRRSAPSFRCRGARCTRRIRAEGTSGRRRRTTANLRLVSSGVFRGDGHSEAGRPRPHDARRRDVAARRDRSTRRSRTSCGPARACRRSSASASTPIVEQAGRAGAARGRRHRRRPARRGAEQAGRSGVLHSGSADAGRAVALHLGARSSSCSRRRTRTSTR